MSSLLGIYLSLVTDALGGYTALLLQAETLPENPAESYSQVIRSNERIQAIYTRLTPTEKTKARSATFRMIKAHAYTVSIAA